MPRISILMPFDNEAPYIAEAVGSVLAQSESDLELIAIDDGSTDGSAEVVRSFTDPRIKLLQPGKVGKNAALNAGFKVATSPVLCYFCADDTLPLDSVRLKLEALSNADVSSEKVMVYGKVRFMSTDPQFDGLIVPKQPNRGSESASAQAFTRPLAELIFPLPEELPNEDQWSALTARIFADRIVHIPVIVWNYRIHASNSHNRYLQFPHYTRQYHARFRVFEVFLALHRDRIPYDSREWLEKNAALETARFEQRFLDMLFINLPLKERIRALVYAYPLFFVLRRRFYRFFSGW